MSGRLQKDKKATVVDLIKLQAQNPQRMEKAICVAKKYEHLCDYENIRLVKTWDDWFVFGLDMDDKDKHNAIMVNSKMDVRLAKLYTSKILYYTNFEISVWRGEVLTELLRIERESPNVDIEQVASEMVGLTDERCVTLMTDGYVYVDIIENARDYANLVTM